MDVQIQRLGGIGQVGGGDGLGDGRGWVDVDAEGGSQRPVPFEARAFIVASQWS